MAATIKPMNKNEQDLFTKYEELAKDRKISDEEFLRELSGENEYSTSSSDELNIKLMELLKNFRSSIYRNFLENIPRLLTR